MDFIFKDNPISQKADTLIFAQKDRVIKYNFKKNIVQVVHQFIVPLLKQPEYFKVNPT
jgi:hypothetical protein